MTDYTLSYLIFEAVNMYFKPVIMDGSIRMMEFYELKHPN
jgi:hypothetical protein